MRVVELGKIATQAEMLRWRGFARRQATRAALGAVGAVFALAALASLHVAAVILLIPQVGLLYAVLIVAGVDLALAILCMVLASRDAPSQVEREALVVRNEARAQLAKAAAFSGLVAPVARRAIMMSLERMMRRRPA